MGMGPANGIVNSCIALRKNSTLLASRIGFIVAIGAASTHATSVVPVVPVSPFAVVFAVISAVDALDIPAQFLVVAHKPFDSFLAKELSVALDRCDFVTNAKQRISE